MKSIFANFGTRKDEKVTHRHMDTRDTQDPHQLPHREGRGARAQGVCVSKSSLVILVVLIILGGIGGGIFLRLEEDARANAGAKCREHDRQ